jgi:hypothetical protein
MARRKAKGRKYPPGVIPGQPAGKHKPFASQAQQRLFFAKPSLRKYALGKAHATGEHHELGKVSSARYKSLPKRKGFKRKARGLKPGH